MSLITGTIRSINEYEKCGKTNIDMMQLSEDDFDIDDSNTDFFTVGKKVKIDLADMNYTSWRDDLKQEEEVLKTLLDLISEVTPENDLKLQTLFEVLDEKVKHPINKGNRKVLIFSAFSDTAEYLYEHISNMLRKNII